MPISHTSASDLPAILQVHRLAFGQDDEADLVDAIMVDPSAKPVVSLMAIADDHPVGHILFSAARLTDSQSDTSAALLAPLAVVPDAQHQGIGGALIVAGLEHLTQTGVALVFVLGDPAYYTRFGFEPASRLDLTAPYPLPDKYADAWMVQALRPDVIGHVRGKVQCCDALAKPEYWSD